MNFQKNYLIKEYLTYLQKYKVNISNNKLEETLEKLKKYHIDMLYKYFI